MQKIIKIKVEMEVLIDSPEEFNDDEYNNRYNKALNISEINFNQDFRKNMQEVGIDARILNLIIASYNYNP